MKAKTIAVLLPCHNEEASIAEVVRDFRRSLPAATIFVYDNNSSDRTAERARDAGASVRHESLQGKGNVVRRMFADVEADVYVMVDGDGTYDASAAPMMIEKLSSEDLDVVVATRLESRGDELFRPLHRFGNVAITRLVGKLFGTGFTDILSGYRVFTKRFVKSFPGLTSGFEIETELTIHALVLRMPVAEIPSRYGARSGSESKLSTFRDGFRILRMIVYFFKEIRPLAFFSIIGLFLALASVALAYPVFVTYLQTGLVPRFPTAILSTGIMLLAFLSFMCGLILSSLAGARWEAKRARYLAYPIVGDPARPETSAPGDSSGGSH